MFKAAHAIREITPGRELSLVGYSQRRELHGIGNGGVNDPLFVRVVVMEAGGNRLVLASLDLCVLTPPLADLWREQLAEFFGLNAGAIILAATHTHSGPMVREESYEDPVMQLETGTEDFDRVYGKSVFLALREAVEEAIGGLKTCRVFFNESPLGLAYNRRVPTKDGIQLCWNPAEFSELAPAPSPDPACGVLTFRFEDDSEIVLFCAGAHPVVMGKESNVVSADWPGAACSELERLHPNRRAIFVLGPCGEVHPWIATQGDLKAVQTVGHSAAHFVHCMAEGSRHSLEIRNIDVRSALWMNMPLLCWDFGVFQIMAAPVELFCSLSIQLRKQVGKPVVLITLANGWQAYFPDQSAFLEGAYEVEVALACGRQSGDGERLIAELAKLAVSAK